MMDYIKLLGIGSYKEGNFFYELEENNTFDLGAYNTLIQNIKNYQKIIGEDDKIDKSVAKNLFIFMPKAELIEANFYDKGYKVMGVSSSEELYDYLDDLKTEIIGLFS